jgi:signal transduction histidine kinase
MSCGIVLLPQAEVRRWAGLHQTTVTPTYILDAADGARGSLAPFSPKAALGPNGRLWFANGESLQTIEPNKLHFNLIPPPVHVEKITADRRTYPIQRDLYLPARTREVSIDYTALSFITPQKIRFRYRLSGVDKTWQDVEGRRQAFYMNLRPGHYSFQVIACNNDGLWNVQGDQVGFTIPPAFYQTVWFLGLMASLLLGILVAIFQLRLRAATAQAESRLSERLAERERIARELHDTLLQGFQVLLLRLQVAINTLPERAPAHEMLQVELNRAESALYEGRTRVRELRSHETGSADMVEHLQRLIEQLREPASPSLRLVVAGTPQAVKIIAADEMSMFAKEALNNAMRYSRGSEIVCEICYERAQLKLACSDDGVGIDHETLVANGKPGHWGLLGMGERARKLDAVMTISDRNPGTRIQLKVPRRIAYVKRTMPLRSRLRSLVFRFRK